MGQFATKCFDAHHAQARERARGTDVAQWTKRAKGDLEPATALGVALLAEQGMELPRAASRMLAPDLSAMLEASIERAVGALYESMDHAQAKSFNMKMDPIEAMPIDALGHFALWAFEDGSAWVALSAHPREMASDALESADFEGRDEVRARIWRLWEPRHAPLGDAVGAKFARARIEGYPLVALDAAEAEAFCSGVAAAWAEGPNGAWGKGLAMKLFSNGAQLTPADLVKSGAKALAKGKEALAKAGMKRAEEARKEREARMKIHWRDAMCMFITQASSAPSYDGGVAAFLMSKPGLFGAYPLPVWRKIFAEIAEILKPLPEGASPELALVESCAAILGADTSSQLAHFLYRYHRGGGAKLVAKRVLEQTRERLAHEAAKHGLAAAVKTRDAPTEEMKESTKLASSVEFSTQYGAALSLYAALWAVEMGFADISLQARAVVRTMRGAGEITMECFGWFARLIFEFSEGFVSKEDIASVLRQEMDIAATAADEEKRVSGKITLENEWSGNWGSELASRKVREYLGLERAR